MGDEKLDERVKLCAARSLGLSDNLNDALVLIDALISSGSINIEIPEQSVLTSITGEEFVANLAGFISDLVEPNTPR